MRNRYDRTKSPKQMQQKTKVKRKNRRTGTHLTDNHDKLAAVDTNADICQRIGALLLTGPLELT